MLRTEQSQWSKLPLKRWYVYDDERPAEDRIIGTITYSPYSPDVDKYKCWVKGEQVGTGYEFHDAILIHDILNANRKSA